MAARSFFSSGELSPAERAKLRHLVALMDQGRLLRKDYDAAEVAAMVGLKTRAVLDLVRSGQAFPNAYKPAHNRVKIPAGDVIAFKRSRRANGGASL